MKQAFCNKNACAVNSGSREIVSIIVMDFIMKQLCPSATYTVADQPDGSDFSQPLDPAYEQVTLSPGQRISPTRTVPAAAL